MAEQKELAWIEEARKYIGLREIRGPRHNKTILNWLKNLNAWWAEDETPWCGVFTAACLQTKHRGIPKLWMRAKAYLDYGTVLSKPAYGSLAIMSRKGGGHVFFVIGRTRDGRIVGLGGNQGDMVSIATFPANRIEGYRWPSRKIGRNNVPSVPYPIRFDLPVYSNDLKRIGSMA